MKALLLNLSQVPLHFPTLPSPVPACPRLGRGKPGEDRVARGAHLGSEPSLTLASGRRRLPAHCPPDLRARQKYPSSSCPLCTSPSLLHVWPRKRGSERLCKQGNNVLELANTKVSLSEGDGRWGKNLKESFLETLSLSLKMF